jgi:hypothetical protein
MLLIRLSNWTNHNSHLNLSVEQLSPTRFISDLLATYWQIIAGNWWLKVPPPPTQQNYWLTDAT